MQDLFQKHLVPNKQIRCQQQYPIERLCINPQCFQNALHCQHSDCTCLINNHENCYSILLFIIKKKVEKIINNQKNYLAKVFQIQDKLIEQIKQTRKQLVDKTIFGDLQDKYKGLIKSIFYSEDLAQFKGKQANELYIRLKESKIQEIWNAQSQEFQIYTNNSRLIMNQLTNLKKKMLYRQSQIEQINRKNIALPAIPGIINLSSHYLDTKIYSSDDPQGIEKIKYIIQQLGNPKSVSLLFRASEHEFKAQEFHKHCDNIQNTFTLIRTQFNKTVGGFTPIKWKKQLNNWAIDQSKSSFLLQLQMKKKMNLIGSEAAIYCNPLFGPTFGGAFDVFISDKCNANNLSSCKFPYSYNYTKEPYGVTQEARDMLCGKTYFKVVEYEVFKVIFADS